jgi:rhodanese-related sulfurtransferase
LNKEADMPITKGYQQLVDEAMAQVTTYSVQEVSARLGDARVQIVDIRDVRELEREGTVPGALLAPRGMLEFWVDPASPYHKPVFADEGKEFILFCGAGWRSALATKTLQDMGMRNVAHIDGGFADWKKQGAPIVSLDEHKSGPHGREEVTNPLSPQNAGREWT